MTYQECLDALFQTFIKAKPFIAGKPDRDTRDPARILLLAQNLGLCPHPERVIKVTGSKGKGTTARMIAEQLHLEKPNDKIGLVISPEEIDHLDRIRLNGQTLPEADFVRLASMILSHLPSLDLPAYYSPYGLFLLIALKWFQEQAVDHLVLECGRGVRFDEGGQLPAQIGVVTSIYPEHLDKIGPSLDDVRADKLSLRETVKHLVTAPQVQGEEEIFSPSERPVWFQSCLSLSQKAVSLYLKTPVQQNIQLTSASFGKIERANAAVIYYEAMVTRGSADRIFWRNLKRQYGLRLLVLLSLTDDKKFSEIEAFFAAEDIATQHIILSGNRGDLCYSATKNKPIFYTGDYEDVSSFRKAAEPGAGDVYAFVGTQTFIRLVKRAFAP